MFGSRNGKADVEGEDHLLEVVGLAAAISSVQSGPARIQHVRCDMMSSF